MAPSMLCHRQAMPSNWSYSARPAFQIASNTPASSHSRKRLCTALALPNRSLGSAFHWQPVRSTYTTASKTCLAGFAGRPAPALRKNCLSAGRVRTGINGSTRCQNSSVTTHDSTRLAVIASPQRAHSATRDNSLLFTDNFKLDLLTCRNLLIYLETDLQKKLLPLFHYSLNPGGVLVLGSAETVGAATDLFAELPGKNRIYRRNNAASRPDLAEFPAAARRRADELPSVNPASRASTQTPNLKALTDALVLRLFSPAAVLATGQGDVVYISAKTGKYLEPATGKANLNLFAMAREGLAGPLNGAFAQAVQQQSAVVLKDLEVGSNGGITTVDVTVLPLAEPAALRGMVLVVFTDRVTQPATKVAAQAKRGSGQAHRRSALAQELEQSRRELQNTRAQMQTSQEELKSANEELQSANEELQSTNEELNTSREEMQSMNEELQTVNHELEAKVGELSRASDDMTNLLNSADIATLLLDNELKVRRFTLQAASVIRLIPGDVGRPVTDLVTTLDYPALADDAREVLRSLVVHEVQVPTRDGRWFNVRGMPYRARDNRIDGLLITFTDISAAKALEATLVEAQAVLHSRFTEKVEALDAAKVLEGALKEVQAVLERRLKAQDAELLQVRSDLRPAGRQPP